MKALTIQQPWAWAIMAGLKTVENRGRRTHYRGPLAIHAGAGTKWIREALEFATLKRRLADLGVNVARAESGEFLVGGSAASGGSGSVPLVFGAILGVVDLIGCVPNTDASVKDNPFTDKTPGGWCWILANPRKLITPVPCRGALSFWQAPPLSKLEPAVEAA